MLINNNEKRKAETEASVSVCLFFNAGYCWLLLFNQTLVNSLNEALANQKEDYKWERLRSCESSNGPSNLTTM